MLPSELPVLVLLCVASCAAPSVAPSPSPAPTSTAAKDSQAPGRELPTLRVAGHDFHRRLLGNGLHAVAVRDSGKGVSIFMVVAVGNRMETAATTGLAHLTEHAMYAGTPSVPAGEHDRRIQAMGGESNAYTRDDFTLYYDHQIPVDQLGGVLAMEADRLVNLDFKKAPVLHERYRLAMEERNTYQESGARDQLLEAAVFQIHPYRFGVLDEDHHTHGPELSVQRVKDFYHRWYHPRNTAVVVVGRIDPERALDQIAAAFGSLPAGPPPAPVPQEPAVQAPRSVKIPSQLPRRRVNEVWIGPAMGDPDRPALDLLARLLGQEKAEDGSPVEASMGGRVDPDLFVLAATGPEAETTLERVEGQAREQSFPSAAVEEAKALTLKEVVDAPLRARPYFALAATFGEFEALGHPEALAGEAAAVEALTPARLREVARKWLDPQHRIRVIFQAAEGEVAELPDDPKALEEAADAAMEAGDLDRAVAAYTKLLDQGVDRMHQVIYLYSRAEVHKQQGDYRAGIADCEAALKVVDYPAVRSLLEEIKALAAKSGGEGGS